VKKEKEKLVKEKEGEREEGRKEGIKKGTVGFFCFLWFNKP